MTVFSKSRKLWTFSVNKNMVENGIRILTILAAEAVLSLPLAFIVFASMVILLMPMAFHGVGDMSYAKLVASIPKKPFTFWVEHIAIFVKEWFEAAWAIAFFARFVVVGEKYRNAIGVDKSSE